MKKTSSAFIGILFFLTAFYPAGLLLCACFGYIFKLTNNLAFSVIIAIISVLTVILSFISKERTDRKITVLAYILTPLSLINAVLMIFESSQIWVAVCVIISVFCNCVLTVKSILTKSRKILVSVLSAISTALLIFTAFMMLTFGNIGQNTVVRTVESPDSEHYAEVIAVSQGALGGDTIVNVHNKTELNTGIFIIRKKPQRVYMGEWGESDSMELYWKNDSCVVVNSDEYEIK